MTEGVRSFLTQLGCGQYYDMFVARGFDLESDISNLNTSDLECMYITDTDHRKKILQAAKEFRPSEDFSVYEWLRDKGLDHYFINFIQSDLTDFDVISRLNLPDENLYDELEITLPGHKRRLERAVHHLSKKKRSDLQIEEPLHVAAPSAFTSGHVDAVELPLAYGRWGKPCCLLEAKYDFLVLDAEVSSTTDPRNTVMIEFMVDSGSDVVTIREEILQMLKLELIGPIRSKGVHAARTKNLYKANLHIGNELLEIEVMGESYDSIGSRVIRHFRHYINGSRHIWLKGDFVDPSMLTETINPSAESQVTVKVGSAAACSQKIDTVTSSHCTRVSQLESSPSFQDVEHEINNVPMETEQSHEREHSTVLDNSGIIVTDSISNTTRPATFQEVSTAENSTEDDVQDMHTNAVFEEEGGRKREEESQGNRIVEVIPVETEEDICHPSDQVDGLTMQTDIVVSSLGRPRQRFLQWDQEQRISSGIHIYEGTSKIGTKSLRQVDKRKNNS